MIETILLMISYGIIWGCLKEYSKKLYGIFLLISAILTCILLISFEKSINISILDIIVAIPSFWIGELAGVRIFHDYLK